SGIGTAAEISSSVKGADWAGRLNPAATKAIAVVASQISKRILRMATPKLRTGYYRVFVSGAAETSSQDVLVAGGLPKVHSRLQIGIYRAFGVPARFCWQIIAFSPQVSPQRNSAPETLAAVNPLLQFA